MTQNRNAVEKIEESDGVVPAHCVVCRKFRAAEFQKSENLPELGPRAKPTCIEEALIVLSVEPNSKHVTVVVLQLSNDTDYYYSVLRPNETYARLSPDAKGVAEYRIWTAFIDPQGRPSEWRMIQQMGNFGSEDAAAATAGSYGLRRVGDFVYENKSMSAMFQWNATHECNIKLASRCEKPANRIGLLPIIVNRENSTVLVKNLTPDSKCTLTLFGKNNRNQTFTYSVPDPRDFLDKSGRPIYPDSDEFVPDQPQILAVTTTPSDDGKAVDVTITWAPPKHRPTAYNVTLHKARPMTIVLPRNASQATFRNVAKSDFLVSVRAMTAAGDGVAVRVVRFYPHRHAVSPWRVWAYASAGVVCAALVVSAVIAALRPLRRRKGFALSPLYFRDMEKKLHKGDNFDNSTTQPIIEDEWEVHPERLLLQEVLGEGAFGIVRKAKLIPSNKLVAVKMLKVTGIEKRERAQNLNAERDRYRNREQDRHHSMSMRTAPQAGASLK
ncbi:Tyrosine-protein kinase receptor torso [Eumeta japonica]|uniref:Tyrosine-protein kinase receptor torso n=1 Tax=Eumeta variegata TaxID=151549 RepID=A0A4C1ULE3_EUMVA|nr:Tyrosine-protein kinase receptor torso [Eumeta japonica]